MQLPRHATSRCSGQIMVEACIGLALMTFVWIMLTYSLFLANNQLRTEMAARYAAWYQGANGAGTPATATLLDQHFFFQTGISTVANLPPMQIADVLTGSSPANASTYSSDGSGDNGPFRVKVTFGVKDPNSAGNPFPFDLLKTEVPLMTNSMMSVYSVSSSCQWDGVAETWTTPGKA